MDYKKLTKLILSEGGPIDFKARLAAMKTPQARVKLQGMHNSRVQGEADPAIALDRNIASYHSHRKEITRHPWIQWLAHYVIETLVNPHLEGFKPLPLPPQPAGLPSDFIEMVSLDGFRKRWFAHVCRDSFSNAKRGIEKGYTQDVLDQHGVSPVSQERIIKALSEPTPTGHDDTLIYNLEIGHRPELIYDLLSFNAKDFWKRIIWLASDSAGAYVWTGPETTDEQRRILVQPVR